MGENFKLRWNDHHSIFFSTAEALCQGDHLTDVTLSCGKREFSAHKLVLSICSTYFSELFAPKPQQKNRPGNQAAIVYLKDVNPRHMELLLNFMYRGEINVGEEELMELLNTARGLQIRGLSESTEEEGATPADDNAVAPPEFQPSTSKGKLASQKAVKRVKSPATPQPSTSSAERSSAAKKIKQESPAPEVESFEEPVPGGEDDYSSHEAVYVEGDPQEEYDLDESSGAGNMFDGDLPPPELLDAKITARCQQCGMTFRYLSKYKEHQLTHTSEKPYECTQCSASYNRKSNLNRHIEKVHATRTSKLVSYVD